MNILANAGSGLGSVLLSLASALLLEELTYGGLVRLLLSPKPECRKAGAPVALPSPRSANQGSRTTGKERKCSH